MTDLNLPVRLPLKPMLAKSVSSIPQPADFPGGLAYEPKWDGFRCIVLRDGPHVELSSRGERPLTRYFPELTAALAAELPGRCVVDGEVVIRNGPRLDFDALTERIHPAASRVRQLAQRTPASFIAFDLLALGDESLLAQPFGSRREMLVEALHGCKAPVHVTPLTLSPEVAARWFEEFEGAGLDGVVAKPLAGIYEPGKRVMFKIKHERTADCVVAGFRWHKSGDGVGSLLLGLYDESGRLNHVGVAASFPASYRVQLTKDLELVRMGDVSGHPWAGWASQDAPAGSAGAGGADEPSVSERPGEVDEPAGSAGLGMARMPGGQSRWTGTRDLSWEPLRPELVVEVGYDHLQGGRLRHTGKLRRWRPDREPASCTYSQLEEPAAYDLDQIFGGLRGADSPDEQGLGGLRGAAAPGQQGLGGLPGAAPLDGPEPVGAARPRTAGADNDWRDTGELTMPLHRKAEPTAGAADLDINPIYVQLAGQTVPKYRMPPTGMLPDTALQVVRDELILDGSSRLNLATFVTTWMEPQARALMAECFDKNMIDKDEYPQTSELERRCVSMLAELWHAPAGTGAPGCSTTGSSEACMLGGMALLWRWRGGAQAAAKPNLVMGSNVQVCWEKFCRYWQVEPRMVPMERGRLHLRGPQAAAACDENTIGVVAIMGSTMDGSYEPVAEISEALDGAQAERGIDVPVHVDAASGGFVAPFLNPDLPWDFRVPRVRSINASGHKYGLVYPGVGWVVWREPAALPDDLVFRVNYLGGDMPTFALNFSRPGGHVAAQYYNFLRLGFEGYRRIQQYCQDIALHLAAEIAKIGPFELLTDGSDLPVFAFKLRDEVTGYSVFDLAERLRQRGWLVPAYTFPANLEDMAVIRIVVRNGFSKDLADLLLDDIRRHSAALAQHHYPKLPLVAGETRQMFAH